MTLPKPHFSFWIVCGVGLVWNVLGCVNFVAQTNPETVANMPEAYQLIILTRPMWATIAFAVAVFGGAAGCLLLLMRREIALWNLAASLVATVLTGVFTVMAVGAVPSMLLAVLVAAALFWYATIVKRLGWLA